MNTQTTALDNSSAHATTPDRILQAFLAAWWHGNIVEAAEQFRDRFTFTDHALGLEFKDKGAAIDARPNGRVGDSRRGGKWRPVVLAYGRAI